MVNSDDKHFGAGTLGILPASHPDTSRWKIRVCGSSTMKNRGRRRISLLIIQKAKIHEMSLRTSGVRRMEEFQEWYEIWKTTCPP
ncbi:uncharacterized protein LACBIDRAFT_310803 [Laccaria bicolor S238N-H82]|uniref:Predicted protein n=1 Tax=Laccaria bicolor (strain S238N-H82 / ATCC MYA-4686) TaxID=486041 RepID=B0DV42_LACBS|nr:uncharacterized protein LACBIDRAFT_310803 [Laccaria bicolor S238N-H82]EDR01512.1 predicted protein [Laccaria bicolor S238N-H82]|eukprot:XP_001887864.1 predicted protein [Laccaria bicolor S238N-H82]